MRTTLSLLALLPFLCGPKSYAQGEPPLAAGAQCVLSGYSPSTSAVYNFQGPPAGKLADDAGSVIHEDLGQQLLAGVETTGTHQRYL